MRASSVRSSGPRAARGPSRAARHRDRGRHRARGTRSRKRDPDQPGAATRARREARSPGPPRRRRRRRPCRARRRRRPCRARRRRPRACPGLRARPFPSAIEGSRARRSGPARQQSSSGQYRTNVRMNQEGSPEEIAEGSPGDARRRGPSLPDSHQASGIGSLLAQNANSLPDSHQASVRRPDPRLAHHSAFAYGLSRAWPGPTRS